MDIMFCYFVLMQVWVTISQTVKIPDYVKLDEAITLNCTSDIRPSGLGASFLVDGTTHTELYFTDNICYKYDSECTIDSCSCSSDGKTFNLIYKDTTEPGDFRFTCSMLFNSDRLRKVMDRITIRVVDVRGPFITSSTGFPLIAGTRTTIHCSVNTPLDNYILALNCSNKTDSQHGKGYDRMCEASVRFLVPTAKAANACFCSMDSREFTTVETFTLAVKNAPLLRLYNIYSCRSQEPITLSCQISGELSLYGFANWTHTLDGVWIRSLQATVVDDTGDLTIESCSFQDLGDYECSAWNTYARETVWANATTVVTVHGTPEVVRANIQTGRNTVLSAVVYSSALINSTEWFFFETFLQNTSQYVQVVSAGKTDVHGNTASIDVYTMNLTMDNVNSGRYTVVVGNRYGQLTYKFDVRNDDNKFDFNVVILVLAVTSIFIITVSMATIVSKGRMTGNSLVVFAHNKAVIYHAALPPQQEASIYDTTDPHYMSVHEDGRDGDTTDPHYMSVYGGDVDTTSPHYDDCAIYKPSSEKRGYTNRHRTENLLTHVPHYQEIE